MNEEEYYLWLDKFLENRKRKYGYETPTPGEFFGFRTAYEAITGNKCPAYKEIGRPRSRSSKHDGANSA